MLKPLKGRWHFVDDFLVIINAFIDKERAVQMNNGKKIWVIVTCASLLTGMILYALLFYRGPNEIFNTSVIINSITALSLYFVAYHLYKQNREPDGKKEV
ncbi:MAG TPA: hypothetical protein VKZ95_02570 [Sphingobacteriaceae bacterium]|nr:hypothetical protein [Sphingobacteriaceae bacterium]